MAYIHNGKVVDKKPFSLKDFILSLWAAIAFFFSSLFSSTPISEQAEDFRDRQRPGGYAAPEPQWRTSLRQLFGNGNGRNSGGRDPSSGTGSSYSAAINRRGRNIHTLPESALNCGGGG